MKKVRAHYALRWQILERDNFTCQYCGQHAPDVILHVDHILPVAKGGDNSFSNLITSCSACNEGKKSFPLLPERKDTKEYIAPVPRRYNQLFDYFKNNGEFTARDVATKLNTTEPNARVILFRAVKQGIIKHTTSGKYLMTICNIT